MNKNDPVIIALGHLHPLGKILGYDNEYELCHDVLVDCLSRVGYYDIAPHPDHDPRKRAVAFWIQYVMAMICSPVKDENSQGVVYLRKLIAWVEGPTFWVGQSVLDGLQNALSVLDPTPTEDITPPVAP